MYVPQVLSHKFIKPSGGLLKEAWLISREVLATVATVAGTVAVPRCAPQACREVDINFHEINVNMNDLSTVVGEGAGGKCYLGTYRGDRVVVKKIKQGQLDEALKEVVVSKRLQKPTPHAFVLKMCVLPWDAPSFQTPTPPPWSFANGNPLRLFLLQVRSDVEGRPHLHSDCRDEPPRSGRNCVAHHKRRRSERKVEALVSCA